MKTKLEPLAAMFQYEITGSDHGIHFVDPRSRILPSFETTGDDDVFIYLRVHTTSWDLEGEHTDVNDAISFFATVFLGAFDISCALWDIPNAFSVIPTELYGRYITVGQPTRSSYRLDEHELNQLKILLFGLRFFEERFGSLPEWDSNLDRMSDATYGWQDRGQLEHGHAKLRQPLTRRFAATRFSTTSERILVGFTTGPLPKTSQYTDRRNSQMGFAVRVTLRRRYEPHKA